MDQWMGKVPRAIKEQCWIALWFLCCSENVRDHLRIDALSKSATLESEVEFEGWASWQDCGVLPLQWEFGSSVVEP